MSGLTEVQTELLLPHEIEAALAVSSVVYLPLGSIEFHGAHLPVGLDGLTARGVCLRAAGRSGGVVMPTLFYGVGGGHTSYPWTIMAESSAALVALLKQTLSRLDDFGVATAVLFSGHFADEQLALVDDVAHRWNSSARRLKVLGLAVNRADARVAPDHAGVFETSLLLAMQPELVCLDQLPALREQPSVDPDGDAAGPRRDDRRHPLWGVFGPDPRSLDRSAAPALLDDVITWTVAQVEQAAGPMPDGPTVPPVPTEGSTRTRDHPEEHLPPVRSRGGPDQSAGRSTPPEPAEIGAQP